MPEGKKETDKVTKKKSSKKDASDASAETEEELEQSPQKLDRDQLEALREKLQRKYH